MDDNGSQPNAGDATARLQSASSRIAQEGKTMAEKVVSEGAGQIERSVQTAAGALRRAADDVPQENSWIGNMLRQGADALERTAGAVRGGGPSDMMSMLQDLARRQPALFIGASVALGFAASRLGKTALSNETQRYGQDAQRDVFPGTEGYQGVDAI